MNVCNNPVVTVNLGQTLDFIIDAPGKPFWIKRKLATGVGEESPIWANVMENNGTESGRLRVRFNQPGTYYYVSEYDTRLSGEIVVLTEALRWPLEPDLTYTVDVDYLMAQPSDAMVLIPGDNGMTDIAGGTNWIFNRPNDYAGFEDIFPVLGEQQNTVKRVGTGSLHFDTPGHPDQWVNNDWYGRDFETIPDMPPNRYWDVGVLRAWGGVNSNNSNHTDQLFPFDDSWTIEFWINFKTFNEDDPTFNADHPANSRVSDQGQPISSYYRRQPYVRLVEAEEDFFVETKDTAIDANGDPYEYVIGLHYPTNLQIEFHPNMAPNTALAYFNVKIWTDDRRRNTEPQYEQKFELPRIVDNGTGERIETIERNQWHHLAFTKDMERECFTVYVDGDRVAESFDSSLGQPMDALGDDYVVGLGGWVRANPELFEFEGNQAVILEPSPEQQEHHASLNGYMDEIRISRGIQYRGPTFSVPTTPHPLTP